MGQQQLLLLVLGIVIVGIAVVAGIQAFSEGRDKAQQDAAVSDAMRIISDVQAWKLKPSAFGGGAEKSGFTDVSLHALGYKTSPYQTVNGCYTLADGTDATLVVYRTSVDGSPGHGSEGDPDYEEPVAPSCQDPIATVTIKGTGTDSQSLSWSYTQ